MLEKAKKYLSHLDPKHTIVNIGATEEGIGGVYHIAEEMGFETTGIVSSLAKKYNSYSPHVHKIYLVDDKTWGGFNPETKTLNPTSMAMIQASDEVIGIGGNEVGRDELKYSFTIGKKTDFSPADMNHKLAIEKAQKKGLPLPTAQELKGAAAIEFEHLATNKCTQVFKALLAK
jgi:hypothetical protein